MNLRFSVLLNAVVEFDTCVMITYYSITNASLPAVLASLSRSHTRSVDR